MCKMKQLEFLREIEKNGNPSKEKKKKLPRSPGRP